MTTKSFEEWKKENIKVSPAVYEDLEKVHGIDIHEDIERIAKREYELYLQEVTDSK